MVSSSRRTFLASAGLAAASLLLPARQPADAAQAKLKGQLLAFGTDGHLFPGFTGKHRNQVSVLTSVDIAEGNARQTALPMGGGHSALGLGEGRILCVPLDQGKSMVVDSQHKPLSTYRAPNKYVYGGHGLVVPERNLFIVCVEFEYPHTLADHGLFEVYDLKTLKLLDRIDTGGIHPHELHVIPGTDELVVSHYGNIHDKKPPFTYNIIDAKLTVYDSKTLKVKRHYPQPDFNAELTHMNVTKDKNAYFVLTQYIEGNHKHQARKADAGVGPLSEKAEVVHDTALVEADMELQKYIGHSRKFAIPYEAAIELKLPVPLPFVCVNTQTGKRTILMTAEANHLRSQSVGYNAKTNTAIGIFYHSDTAIMHRPGTQPEVLNSGTIGLSELRGITDIPGTSCIGLVGAHRGMVIYDLASRSVVARYPHQYFDTVHLSYDRVV